MKKILVSLLVLALCAPAMAATITVVDDLTGTSATITVATVGAEPNIVGVALDVDLDEGSVTAVSITTPNFNVYPDAGYSLGTSFDPWGTPTEQGGPVALQGSAGQQTLPRSSFALSFANLNGEFEQGAAGAASIEIKLTLSDPNKVTVCENATRGGLVAVDGTALDADCDFVLIAAVGPACWNFDCHAKADSDGDCDVDVNDVNVAVAGWSDYNGTTSGIANLCADTDDDGDVDVNDINALADGWTNGCGTCTPI